MDHTFPVYFSGIYVSAYTGRGVKVRERVDYEALLQFRFLKEWSGAWMNAYDLLPY
jgi:hypothetical protein